MTNTNKKRKISLKPLKIKLSIFNAIIGVTVSKILIKKQYCVFVVP